MLRVSLHPKPSRRCVLCDREFWFRSPSQKACSKKCAIAARQAYKARWNADPAHQQSIVEARQRWEEKHR